MEGDRQAVPPLSFGTKAETLARLRGRLTCADVLPQAVVTVGDWRAGPDKFLEALRGEDWGAGPLIARSSALGEEDGEASLAGHYLTIPNVTGDEALAAAIDDVIVSYVPANDGHQVLVQPMLQETAASGVAFGCDPNTGGPYLVVEYEPGPAGPAAITGGTTGRSRVFFRHRAAGATGEEFLDRIGAMMDELSVLFGTPRLDVEFAIEPDSRLLVLQVRPLHGAADPLVGLEDHARAVADVADKITSMARPHPHLLGGKGVFGIMPDWNPAEIIGVRPRPLALSLYRELVTDSIWAYQRDNYGYRNLRSFPLLLDFHGLPYVDVRVSFNSFVPKGIDEALAGRLVDYYIDRLLAMPELHDKVEFEVIFSCYTPDLPERLAVLRERGFSEEDCAALTHALKALTGPIIDAANGLWRRDLARVGVLDRRHNEILASGLDRISQIYWLIEECKRYGTLPFAGLARAAFIAVQMLRSLVAVGAISGQEMDAFMGSLDTVSSKMKRDFFEMDRAAFLERYGHLRPGTYDILSPRYDELPDLYFDWGADKGARPGDPAAFELSSKRLAEIDAVLAKHGIDQTAAGLFEFIRAAIEGREQAKFIFTKVLSRTLTLIREFGADHGFDGEDCSFADIAIVRELYTGSFDAAAVLRRSVEAGRRRYELTQSLALPPLISDPGDPWAFHMPPSEPNFITQGRVSAPVARESAAGGDIAGTILMIPSADPGYDWIFSRGIAGFVTAYGGANSHMAIRAGELGLPAVIGAGAALFSKWAEAHSLEIDCANRQVLVLK